MSDESVRLALRVHDEVNTLFSGPLISISDPIGSVMEVTCSDLTSARVVHTLFSASKKQLKRHRKVEVGLSSTSERKDGLLVKLRR